MKLLLNNWIPKLGSLFFALLLFWYVKSNLNISRDIQVRVEVPDLPKGMIVSGRLPAYLNVRLSGPRELMDFPVSDFKIRLLNSKPKPSEETPFRTELRPEPPSGVKAKYKSGIHLNTDRLIVRELHVDPVISIKLEPGFEPGVFQVTPRTVLVRGPRRIVTTLESLKTQPIIVSGKEQEFNTRVFLAELPPYTNFFRQQPLDISFQMLILNKDDLPEDQTEITLSGIKPVCMNTTPGYKALFETEISATIRLPDKSRNLDARHFNAMVFCRIAHEAEGKKLKVIQNVPVYIIDRKKRKFIKIIRVHPPRITMNFKVDATSGLRRVGRDVFRQPKKQ